MNRDRRPPGPRLPGPYQTLQLFRAPLGSLSKWQQRYGDVFRVNFFGFGTLVYVARPELAQQVFATDRDVGRAGEARKGFLEPVVGAHSLLTLDGDEWMRHRKMLGSAFHGKSVESYGAEVAAIADAEIDQWPSGTSFSLLPRMQAITLEVILRVMFGIRDAERLERLRVLLPAMLDASDLALWVLPMLPASIRARLERATLIERLPDNPVRRFLARRAEVDELLYAEISRRRTSLAEQAEDEHAGDILSRLLLARDADDVGLTDVEIRDELITLLLAGYETTSTALSWAFERLLRNSAVLDRLTDELAASEEHYLEAVIKETLRSRPVVADMPRVLTEPIELGGYTLPAGWWVSPAAPLLHDRPDLFADPESFRPERFLDSDSPPQGWVPFGGGRRHCLGNQLAMLELRTVIPQVLRRVQLQVGDPSPEAAKLTQVTLKPAQEARVQARVNVGAEEDL